MRFQFYIDQSHKDNRKWWIDINTGMPLKRDKTELLLLVNTEIAEAVEGLRKDLMDDHLPHRKMAEVEIADALIRIFDFCGGFGIDLDSETEKFSEEPWVDLTDLSYKSIYEDTISETLMSAMHNVTEAWNSYFNDFGRGVAESLYLAVSILLGAAHQLDYDIDAAYQEKRQYNAKRSDHTHERRRDPHGKKF